MTPRAITDLYARHDGLFFDVLLEVALSGDWSGEIYRCETTYDTVSNETYISWTLAEKGAGFEDTSEPIPPEVLAIYEAKKNEIMLIIMKKRLKGEL